MTEKKYNVVIVDDEFLARKLLQDYVSKINSLQLVASCANAVEAIEALKNNKVDILLLDIQMPDITGLELVQSLEHKPAVIFTTAYSEFAVDAFNLGVTDYLLKPFDFHAFSRPSARLLAAMRRRRSSMRKRLRMQSANPLISLRLRPITSCIKSITTTCFSSRDSTNMSLSTRHNVALRHCSP